MPQLALGQGRQSDQTLHELEEFRQAALVSTGRLTAERSRIRLVPANATVRPQGLVGFWGCVAVRNGRVAKLIFIALLAFLPGMHTRHQVV